MPVNNNKRVLWIFAVRSESPGFLPKSKFSFNLILLFSVSRKKENKKIAYLCGGKTTDASKKSPPPKSRGGDYFPNSI
jgi:hypothetical protein